MQSSSAAPQRHLPIRKDWLAATQEKALEPDRPIIDPHHHLWDRPGNRYLLHDLVEDTSSGHNIRATVFLECREMYRAEGPPETRSLGETEFVAGVAAILVTLLALFFNRTRIGRALRAVADDHQAALAVGIPLQQIWAIVWGVAGAIALVAGLLWGARNGVQYALTFVALKALPVLILGGFESIPGAIVGGLIIGASEKLAEVYLGPFVGGGIEGWFPYVLALLFLLIRPEGLFGEKIIRRI